MKKLIDNAMLLDDCIMHLDGSALQAALAHVEEALKEGSSPDTPIPFPTGSDAWCFSFLILHKPWRSLYTKNKQPLLEPHQSAKDALIESGMVCAQCFAVGVGAKAAHQVVFPLKRCAKCHMIRYCSGKCQKKHWKEEHKFRCGAGNFIVGDIEERHFREFLVGEMQGCQQFVIQHPFPEYKRMFLLHQCLLLHKRQQEQEPNNDNTSETDPYRFLISAYTQVVHKQLERVYQSLGKNTFEENAVTLAEYLDQVGGVKAMEMVYEMMYQLFRSLDEKRLDASEENEGGVLNGVGNTALLQLGSSWDHVESWEKKREVEKGRFIITRKEEVSSEEEETETEEEETSNSGFDEDDLILAECAAE